jgi:hypothetical protein
MRNKYYLTNKVQPGEIQPGFADAAKALAEADDLVAYGLRRGLMSYPHGTQFDATGRPIPKLQATRASYTKPIESYSCLRAYLMRDNGSTHAEIARAVQCSIVKVPAIIAHGKTLWLAQKAATSTGKGKETNQQSKRASEAAAHAAGHPRAGTSPRMGTLPAKTFRAGAKADR